MSETVTISFIISRGILMQAIEKRWGEQGVTLTGRRDIEDAVARVANTPVSGSEEKK